MNGKWMHVKFLFGGLASLMLSGGCADNLSAQPLTQALPNIVIFNLDDLGYGDIGAYGAMDIPTPNIDRLAAGGIRFTNGYSTSSTCTPSRFGLLTGVYPWRKNAQILPGTAPLLIDVAQQTLPRMLKQAGYRTGIVGKWHLGLGTGNINWNGHIAPGPNELGFDESFIMAATQDRVPTVYIRNGRVVGLDDNDPIEVSYEANFAGEPTGRDNPDLLRIHPDHGHDQSIVNGISRIGYMRGGKSARWVDEDMSDVFLGEAQSFVRQRSSTPFFLYYAMHQPHVPRTPHPRFVGATNLGPRGDSIVEADHAVGAFVETLEQEGVLDNTLIVFTSDNGPVINDGYVDDAVERIGNHRPGGPLRGGKYSLYEAGFRVSFIVYWKGKLQPQVSDAVVNQLDLLASLARLTGQSVSGLDSQDHLDAFLGNTSQGRDVLVLEATTRTMLRHGDWVMIPPYPGPKIQPNVQIELGNSEHYQLYNLKDDIAEESNLAEKMPDKLQEMMMLYTQLRY